MKKNCRKFQEVKPMNRQRGFTLVELLVVITIIGILIAIAVPSVSRIRERAKELQVQAGMQAIVHSLELFNQNNGSYPGVALPICDDDGLEPFSDASGGLQLFAMRGVVGGGYVKHDPGTYYFDGFYFTPQPPAVTPGIEQIPDRLISSGSMEVYPTNFFRKNIPGLTNKGIPMVNVWGVEFLHDFTANLDPLDFHLSYPLFFDQANPGDYKFPKPSDYTGPSDFTPFYLGDWRGVIWDANGDGKVNEGELQKTFPEGDFAYIPLDPVVRDVNNPQFMRFCQNYWLIGYGSKRTAVKNKYAAVDPQFPRPLGDGNPATTNDFERAVKNALIGAAYVMGTKYTEQFNVSGNE
jgi:prepilin-type N-terminal cleavage/methylation domain-containing protein